MSGHWFSSIAAFLVLLFLTETAEACPDNGSCPVADGGSYEVLLPPGYDADRPAPVLIYYHGYKQTGGHVLSRKHITVPAAEAGVILVAPNGLNRTWAHQGAPSTARDEMAFFDRMLLDIKTRWNIDADRIRVSGFSQGGSMAWDIACRRGHHVSAFFPAAGAFWRPHPDTCPAGPVNIAHVHGKRDTVVPMTGRPIGGQWHQGDVLEGVAFFRKLNRCGAAEKKRVMAGMRCRSWSDCGSGKQVRLCLHDGGHTVPGNWIRAGIKWADKLVQSR